MFVDIFEIFHWINFLNLIENYFEGIKDVEVERSFDSPRAVCSESYIYIYIFIHYYIQIISISICL